MQQNIFNDDFRDFILCLNKNKLDYLLVGAYSVILHGYYRTTGDLDIWVDPTAENYQRLILAFQEFGMPVFDMSEPKFLDTNNNDVFTFGRPPVCIDILTKVKGLEFRKAFESSQIYQMEEDFFVRMISKADLIIAKESAGRNKDISDIEGLKTAKD